MHQIRARQQRIGQIGVGQIASSQVGAAQIIPGQIGFFHFHTDQFDVFLNILAPAVPACDIVFRHAFAQFLARSNQGVAHFRHFDVDFIAAAHAFQGNYLAFDHGQCFAAPAFFRLDGHFHLRAFDCFRFGAVQDQMAAVQIDCFACFRFAIPAQGSIDNPVGGAFRLAGRVDTQGRFVRLGYQQFQSGNKLVEKLKFRKRVSRRSHSSFSMGKRLVAQWNVTSLCLKFSPSPPPGAREKI